jgi:hypothetical protein
MRLWKRCSLLLSCQVCSLNCSLRPPFKITLPVLLYCLNPVLTFDIDESSYHCINGDSLLYCDQGKFPFTQTSWKESFVFPIVQSNRLWVQIQSYRIQVCRPLQSHVLSYSCISGILGMKKALNLHERIEFSTVMISLLLPPLRNN